MYCCLPSYDTTCRHNITSSAGHTAAEEGVNAGAGRHRRGRQEPAGGERGQAAARGRPALLQRADERRAAGERQRAARHALHARTGASTTWWPADAMSVWMCVSHVCWYP